MAIYVTSDGTRCQERISQALQKLGAQRLVNPSRVQAYDTVVVQGTALPSWLTAPEGFSRDLTLIAWLPTYDWSTASAWAEQVVRFCRQCTAVVAPTAQVKDWLVRRGLASERIATCPLVGGSGADRQPVLSRQVYHQLPAQLPRPVAIAKLNQAGGWGELGPAARLTYPQTIIDFISAGLPLLIADQAPAAELVDQYQIGWRCPAGQDKRAALTAVTAEQYQQLAGNVRRLGELLDQDYFIRQAFDQARYQARVSSIDATSQHPRFNIRVLDNQATLDYIERYHPSVARLGDGEISLMLGADQAFQDTDSLLEKRLREIVETPSSPRLLVCLSDTFHDIGRLVPPAQRWWRGHQQTFAAFYEQLGQRGNVYGNTMVTRPYMDMQDRNQAGTVFHRIKKWWQDRDLLIVEGAYTRSGVGNDLYDNARSVQRIICPPKNAWGKYREIEAAIKKYGEGKLVLVMLGMAATVIAADLADWGQVIDSGHLDPEYEWYRQGAVDRVPIQGKHTAEMNFDEGVPQSIADPQYNAEIILNLTD